MVTLAIFADQSFQQEVQIKRRDEEKPMIQSSGPKPAFSGNNTAIIFASSAYYAPYLATTIQSVIQTSTAQNVYDIIVIHREVAAEDQAAIRNMAKDYRNISIRFLRPDEALLGNQFRYREDVAAAPESFYCVLLPELLPAYQRAICMDCDVVALHDVAELYETDVTGYLVAATKDLDGIGNSYADDAGKNLVENQRGRADYMYNVLGLRNLEDYFQSGVMVINLEEFRRRYTIEQILEVACAGYIQWGDQDTMNALCKNSVLYLDQSWNLIINWHDIQLGKLRQHGPRELMQEYETARKAPKIIHYAGVKPWKVFDVDLFPYFWEAAIQTPFYETILARLYEAQKGDGLEQDEECRQRVIEQYHSRRLGLRYIGKFLRAWWKGKRTRPSVPAEAPAFTEHTVQRVEEAVEEPLQVSYDGPIVTVIVPCRNVESYLKPCLDSILEQTLESIEIIVVDNHSTDGTVPIIARYAEEHPNIHGVYFEKDCGPSAARNRGIELAKGKYVAFCDADDSVPEDAYERLVRRAEQSDADLVAGSFLRLYESGEKVKDTLPGETAFEKCLYMGVIWNKIYPREYLLQHKLRFSPEIKHYEDILFSAKILQLEPKIGIEPGAVYRHLETRPGGTRKDQLSSVKTYEMLYSLSYMVGQIFKTRPERHVAVWKRFYFNQLHECYQQRWMGLTGAESIRLGFESLRSMIEVGEKSGIVDWDMESDQREFSDIFHMSPFLFKGMSFESYILFLSLQRLTQNQGAVIQPAWEDAREKTLTQFRGGEIGFRYIWRYFKGWLYFKLHRPRKQ